MSRVCDSCGKKTVTGQQYTYRGLAKAKGGVGIKTTGITKRTFKPNLQKVRTIAANGAVGRSKVCAQCLRSGKVRKPPRREIPEGLLNRMRAVEEAKSPEARRAAAMQAGDRRRKRRAEAKAREAAKAKAKA